MVVALATTQGITLGRIAPSGAGGGALNPRYSTNGRVSCSPLVTIRCSRILDSSVPMISANSLTFHAPTVDLELRITLVDLAVRRLTTAS